MRQVNNPSKQTQFRSICHLFFADSWPRYRFISRLFSNNSVWIYFVFVLFIFIFFVLVCNFLLIFSRLAATPQSNPFFFFWYIFFHFFGTIGRPILNLFLLYFFCNICATVCVSRVCVCVSARLSVHFLSVFFSFLICIDLAKSQENVSVCAIDRWKWFKSRWSVAGDAKKKTQLNH